MPLETVLFSLLESVIRSRIDRSIRKSAEKEREREICIYKDWKEKGCELIRDKVLEVSKRGNGNFLRLRFSLEFHLFSREFICRGER